jgi:hypothetical protein
LEATRSLFCAPPSFVWFFQVDGRQGVQPTNVKLLWLSRVPGSNGRWNGLWRNQLAMKPFAHHLPDDLEGNVLDEFVKLVNTGSLYERTVAIFAPPAFGSNV